MLDPSDEYTHQPGDDRHYNESMYLNSFDLEAEVGGWFRLGNRVNEGYAEMTVCTYLPGGRVGFIYDRPAIGTNDSMDAGGLSIEVVEPFAHLRVTYDGRVCLLDDPGQMADPRAAFRDNPHVECRVDLDIHGCSPMYEGGSPDGDEEGSHADHARDFASAHYEQHTTSTGTIRVGDEILEIDGVGLRDKSWGPRRWQALSWYRWLPMSFGEDFAMALSIVGSDRADDLRSGMVLVDGEYHTIRDFHLDSDWDDRGYQRAMRCVVHTDHDTYEVEGEVISLIPLRNRRTTPSGDVLTTRITEAMTRYCCGGRRGIGMSEYLDQIIDGHPIGPDVVLPGSDPGGRTYGEEIK